MQQVQHACEDPEDHSVFHNWDSEIYPDDCSPPDVLLGELLLYYFEWMSRHKVTDACAKSVYGLLKLLMPADTSAPEWCHLKQMLESVYEQNVLSVDLCPNDCMAFIDCSHPQLASYQHSHRTRCLHCNALRYVEIDGKKKAKPNFL